MPVPLKPIFDMLMSFGPQGQEIFPTRMSMKQFLIKNLKNSIDETKPKGLGVFQATDSRSTQRQGFRNPHRDNLSLCSNCHRGMHSPTYCFWHPDREVGHQNQMRANLTSCLLCKSPDHLSINCDLYKKDSPVYQHCDDCFEKHRVKPFHSSKKCIGLAENRVSGKRVQSKN